MSLELMSAIHAAGSEGAMPFYAASRQSAEIFAMEIHNSIHLQNDNAFALQVKLWIGKESMGERSLGYRQNF
jgi:hypothetical protein